MRGKGEEVCACGAALRGIGRVADGVGESLRMMDVRVIGSHGALRLLGVAGDLSCCLILGLCTLQY